MKLFLLACLAATLLPVSWLFYQGHVSQQGQAPGLVNEKLATCPDRPNCVCTEFPGDASHYSQPIHTDDQKSTAILLKSAYIIKTMGGVITYSQDHYLAATFTSHLFGFVDDVEIRWDTDTQQLHLRSASRAGYSDMGINKQRVDTFKQQWLEAAHSSKQSALR